MSPAATELPVYRPTLEEFSDFLSYVQKIEPECEKLGACKIVPPAGWWHRDYENLQLSIPYPILQCVSGKAGVYNVDLVEKKAMTLDVFKAYAEDYERRAVRGERGERKKMASSEDFDDEEYVEHLERQFWKSLTGTMEPPLYGADIPDTLFHDDPASSWNLDRLHSVLSVLENRLPGINSSMLYFGMWRAMFAIHKEDVDLNSINYLHLGKPKFWYAVPPSQGHKVEIMAQSSFPDKYNQCHEFLRHKASMFSPTRLKDSGISFVKGIQRPGEFVITFPGSYHFGFNLGFNIAEAVNFGTDRWIAVGLKAKVCSCRPDSVRIDMEHFMKLYNGEVEEEDEEDEGESSEWSEADDPSVEWRFRCCCGLRCTNKNPTPECYERSFECTGCGCWSHIKCEWPALMRKKDHELPEELHCRHCKRKEAQDNRQKSAEPSKKRPRWKIGMTVEVAEDDDLAVWEEGLKKDDDEWLSIASDRLRRMRKRKAKEKTGTESSAQQQKKPKSAKVVKKEKKSQTARQEREEVASEEEEEEEDNKGHEQEGEEVLISGKITLEELPEDPLALLDLPLEADDHSAENDRHQSSRKAVRKERCKKCSGCLTPDCGKCIFCLDKVKFGGPGKRKRCCIMRVCQLIEPKPSGRSPKQEKGRTKEAGRRGRQSSKGDNRGLALLDEIATALNGTA